MNNLCGLFSSFLYLSFALLRHRKLYVFEEWYDQLGGETSTLADAIIDRIAHDSYQINITSIDAENMTAPYKIVLEITT